MRAPHNDGYVENPQFAPPATSVPAGANVAQPMSQEQRMGMIDYQIYADARLASPEDSNADLGLVPPAVYNAAAVAQVPFAIPIQGNFTKIRSDYNVLSNYQYVRDGAALVNALGRNDQDEQNATQDGNVFKIDAPATPNLVLGFFLEWSLQLQVSSAFTMEVSTRFFKGLCYQDVNRNFSLRISSGSQANGGIMAVLFGQRMDANDTCGVVGACGSSPATGAGGMQKAIVQPAWIPPTAKATNPNTDPIETYNVSIAGLVNNVGEETPQIWVTVPTGLEDGFGVLARYITAGSPQMADLRASLNLATAIRRAA